MGVNKIFGRENLIARSRLCPIFHRYQSEGGITKKSNTK
jgi:hypothetical protein